MTNRKRRLFPRPLMERRGRFGEWEVGVSLFEERQRVNMEAAVNSLETMFQVAESDLDHIQSMLEFEMMKGVPGELSQEENPLALIRQLSVMKLRYKMLCERLQRISAEQQESMRSINATLNKTLRLVQKIQQHAGIETFPLSEEQQLAMQQIRCHLLKKADASAKQTCPIEHQIQ